jgi:hypothetical protein
VKGNRIYIVCLITLMSLLGLKCTDIIFSSGHTRARFEIEAVYDIGDSSQGSYLAKDYYKYFKDKYLYFIKDTVIGVYLKKHPDDSDLAAKEEYKVIRFIEDSTYKYRLIPSSGKYELVDTFYHVLKINTKYILLEKRMEGAKLLLVFKSNQF